MVEKAAKNECAIVSTEVFLPSTTRGVEVSGKSEGDDESEALADKRAAALTTHSGTCLVTDLGDYNIIGEA